MTGNQVQYIVVHCADTPPEMDVSAADIDRWHKQNGWDGIGYHFVIRRSGLIESGRPLDADAAPGWQIVQGAHVAGMNSKSIGICLAGGKGNTPLYTGDQMASLRYLVEVMTRQFPQTQVVGHRDLDKGKTCPNFNVAGWWAEQRRAA